MTAFVWVMLGLLVFDALMKLIGLAMGDGVTRSPTEMAFDVALNAALSAWAIVLLVRS